MYTSLSLYFMFRMISQRNSDLLDVDRMWLDTSFTQGTQRRTQINPLYTYCGMPKGTVGRKRRQTMKKPSLENYQRISRQILSDTLATMYLPYFINATHNQLQFS